MDKMGYGKKYFWEWIIYLGEWLNYDILSNEILV